LELGEFKLRLIHWESLFATVASKYLNEYRFHMDPIVVKLLERGLNHSATDLYKVNIHRGDMHTKLSSIMKDYDCLVCPTTALPSVPVDHDQSSDNFFIEGQRVDATYGWFLTNPFNLMSQSPVISVPSGFSSSGVPTGIQIIGRNYDDINVFRVATAYETARPWNNVHPRI
jgi:Asp-tRNA(Asn)/Glu-tRNA(Gln) amidotransferase A subunit family amidase